MNNCMLFSFLLVSLLFITHTLSYKHISVNVNYKSKFIRLYDNNKKNDNLDKWFQEELKEGTTHIKYNKYAPSSAEAKNMTSQEFRKVIFDKMIAAQEERRKAGPVGNAVSDNYLNALEKDSANSKKKSFNPFKK